MRLGFGTIGAVLLLSLGCAGRTEPVVLGLPDEPRASWLIKAGANYGAEREVCRSDRPEPCVIPASSAEEPTSAVVSVFLYPAGDQPTTYKGALLSSFMGSSTSGHETPVDFTLKPGERPGFIASVGRVKPVPGNYEFRVALFAEFAGQANPRQFQQTIPIRIVPTASRS